MDSVQIISKVVSRKREGVYLAHTSSGGGGGTTIVEGDKSASIMLMKLFTPLTADNVEIPINDTTSEIKRIRANFDLFSVGDVSAKGIGAGSGEGGSTGGASTLGGLLNVGAWADEVPTVDRIMYQPAGGTHWTSKSLSEIISGKEYATKEELNAVNAKIDNFLTGTDTDNIINKWVELEAFLAGMSESSTLSSLLQNKADKSITISAGAGLSGGGDLSANRTLSLAASGISAGTYTKVTVDVYGRVTGGTSLAAGDIPGLPWSKITSGKPTTLSGYGITDAYTKEVSDARFLQKGTFDDLFEKVNIGTSAAPVYAIKAKYTFYSVGDVVAKGIGGDTGTGSPGSLESLLDVSLTAPSSGEVLMYNGSHWVNSEIQQGLDTSAMWAELKKSDSANVINISHIPNIGWAKITGKPTTLAGYGITDGVNSVTLSGSGNAVTGMSFSGHSLTLTKGATFLDITAMWNALKAADTSKVIDISHIPSIGWGKITGKPTTLAGYGITDGINSVTLSGSGNAITGMSFSGHSLTLTKGATFLAKATFDDLFEKVNIGTSSAPVYAIKAKYTFYSVGDVVAKGIDADSGAGAGGSLSGLIDVTLTSPASGQILMYNGSHWVNSTIQQGLDVSAMWTELKKSDAANVINISHIPGLPWAKITSGKPTTLAGYGITDAYTKAQADSKYVTALGTSGNYLTWTKNGTVNNITVPYATNADTVDGYHATMLLRSVGRDSATLDLNTYIDRTVKEIRTTEQTTTNSPFSGFGVLVNLMDGSSTAGYAKLQIAVAAGGNMYFRSHQSSAASITTAWRTVVDSVNRASLLDSFYVKKTGDTMTGILTMANAQPIILNQSSATSLQYIRFGCADNDFARIAAGGTASNAGWMEIATADDGNEPIYARQYTGVYSNLVRTATLLDASGNTQFPGTVQANYFTCRNTTLCTNLNANYLEGYTNMGFIHSNFSAQTGGTAYVSGDTHRMKVAEIGINTHYSSYVLLLSHEFWGHQHYSALLLHIAVTNNDNSGNKNPRCAVHVMSRTGNNGNINPVYYKVENNKAYIYIEVYGGNSYGNWNTTVLQARDSITTNNANSRGNLKLTFEFNQPTANMVAANYNNYINAMGFMDGSNQNTFVRKAGDTMTGLLTLKTGSSHTGIKCGNSYMSAIDGSVIFQNNAGGIRFSTVDNWDWNVWAGLKYVHSSKTVYLGLADGTIFTTNTAQTGGTVSMVNCKVQADYYLARNTTLCTNLNADLLDSKHESAFTSIIGRHSFNTDGTAPYAYIHLFRIANSHGYSTLRVDIDFKSRNHAATLYIDIVANQYPYNSGGTYINIYKETKSGRTCTFYVKQTIQSSNYNYYDIYYNSGAWNTGSYDVKLRGINGGFIFEPKNQKINSLPSGYSTVTETSFFGNAASANQLYTARTINGTSFNGTANITTSYWGTTRTFYTNSHDSYGASAGVNVNGSGNVTLLLPSSIRCSNWFRSTGNTGWYNQTYSGGIYMDDNTYVKVYNNKSFYVSGNILATGDVMAKSNSSDIRLKKDIQGYDAMSIIRGFRSVRYHWNEEAKRNSVIFAHDKWNFGLIAQDLLQGGYDQWVSDVFKDYYTISYERLIPVLWKGVQEIDSEVVALRRRVEYLENEIKRLCA